ncbi:hypothetical protein [Kitasatospora xanthocidica]|uniref:hypothetical protein n=1 Tax=Kitasatospora xanthocidica TaxID=83382 RepID=UPI0016738408|nr:hypothetical protein [Kitasatospora xanthocidica]
MASDLAALRRMERHLRGRPERADFLLDLSNIVRERGLGGGTPRALDRLRLVLAALRAFEQDREVTVHAIADDSLLRPEYDALYPDPAEPALLRQWRDHGLITSRESADPDLLDHARSLGTPVISSDLYTGHRGRHPWIQGDRERFLAPAWGGGRPVRLVRRDMRVFADRVVSREREIDDLRASNLLVRGRPRAEILERSWRCPVDGCHPAPAVRRDKVVCRAHGTLLKDTGPRRRRAQLKVLVDGECRAWENLTEDDRTEFVLGRANLARIEDRHLDEDRRLAVSRRHLLIVSRRGTLRALDTSGKAVSRIRTIRPGQDPTPWKPLPHLREACEQRPRERLFHAFGPDDEIEVQPGIVLRRSGQRWPGERAEGVRAKPPRRPPDGDEPTRQG